MFYFLLIKICKHVKIFKCKFLKYFLLIIYKDLGNATWSNKADLKNYLI